MSVAADPYSRCPDCRFIASPESMDYTLTGPPPDGDIDWSCPVHVTCGRVRAGVVVCAGELGADLVGVGMLQVLEVRHACCQASLAWRRRSGPAVRPAR
jgi:hypothetical protein